MFLRESAFGQKLFTSVNSVASADSLMRLQTVSAQAVKVAVNGIPPFTMRIVCRRALPKFVQDL